MIDVGQKAPEFRGDGSTIKGVVEELKYNKVRALYGCTNGVLDLTAANSIESINISPYPRWRVVALGMYWAMQSTANEDPIIDFGYYGNDDAFGKMTSAITGGEKFCVGDHQKYDPLGLLASEIITEASGTLAITWTEGVKFGVWQTSPLEVWCREAAVAGMTTGQIKPYMIIEIKTGGKW